MIPGYTVRIVRVVTGLQLRQARLRFGDTQRRFADRLGVTANTVARWERDEMRVPKPIARLVECLSERAPKAQPARQGRRRG